MELNFDALLEENERLNKALDEILDNCWDQENASFAYISNIAYRALNPHDVPPGAA